MREVINSHIDIAIVSDTRLAETEQVEARNTWNKLTSGHSIWSSFVCVLCKPNIGLILINQHQNGRVLEIDFYCQTNTNEKKRLYACYLPPSTDQNALSLESLASELRYSEHVFFGGDLNCVSDPSIDTWNSKRRNPYPGKKSLLEIAQNLKISDVYRRLYPEGGALSRIDLAKSSGSRIDTLFVSDEILKFLQKSKYL